VFQVVSLFAYRVADPTGLSVDYILFLTADVTVNGNPNEIRDYKYVDKAELQAMFEDQGMQSSRALANDADYGVYRQLVHAVVQAHRPRFPFWLVG
jgi:isopentenyldiphosphate isomerase